MELIQFNFNVMVLKGVNEWGLYIVGIGLERSQLIQFKFNVMVLKWVNWSWKESILR